MFVAIGGAVSPAFISGSNLSNLLLQVSPLGIVVIGQAFVILVRGLDLSVASMMATAAVIATGFSGRDADVPAIVALSLAIGLAYGLPQWAAGDQAQRVAVSGDARDDDPPAGVPLRLHARGAIRKRAAVLPRARLR